MSTKEKANGPKRIVLMWCLGGAGAGQRGAQRAGWLDSVRGEGHAPYSKVEFHRRVRCAVLLFVSAEAGGRRRKGEPEEN